MRTAKGAPRGVVRAAESRQRREEREVQKDVAKRNMVLIKRRYEKRLAKIWKMWGV